MSNSDHTEASTTAATAAGAKSDSGYQVLARKYRPQSFATLIGQDALVRTLSNAIAENRIAHAFILTGVRGVGKTTTARIIARALNCVGPDGTGGPTVEPCDVCDNCRAIADSRHVDVLEMDAASRTGVDNMRELLDGVRYRPVSARYKIYIIDEVHMLSNQAFNALLKTLEEPPEHVKFVFATTEIRKVPVTVLSRCQRFDLRRVDIDLLHRHFAAIVAQEGAEAEDVALAMIARAAEGSVRDGLSILDQAIAHTAGKVTAGPVREMLGLADRARTFDLFEALMRGQVAKALAGLREQYDLGADPAVVPQDLLDLTHMLTRFKVVPTALDDVALSDLERERGGALASGLGMPELGRAWQMLLKGLGEVRNAPSAIAAAEMVLVRLAYSSNLPSPEEALRRLESGDAPAAGPAATSGGQPATSAPAARAPAAVAPVDTAAPPAAESPTVPTPKIETPRIETPAAEAPVAEEPRVLPAAAAAPSTVVPMPASEPSMPPEPMLSDEPYDMEDMGDWLPESIADILPATDDEPDDEAAELAASDEATPRPMPEVVDLESLAARAEAEREARLYVEIIHNIRLVSFQPGRMEIRPVNDAPTDLVPRLMDRLAEWTGRRWVVTISTEEEGQLPLAEQRELAAAERLRVAAAHPAVLAALDVFPGAEISAVFDIEQPQDAVEGDSVATAKEMDRR